MYSYQKMKPELLTEDGFKKVLEVYRNIEKVVERGAIIFTANDIIGLGDTHLSLAAIDYLVENRLIREIPTADGTFAQDRIFVKS